MAITNAQQYQQLVNPPMKGNKRPGYRGQGSKEDKDNRQSYNAAQAAANVGRASTASSGRQDPRDVGFDAREAQISKQYGDDITPTGDDGRIIPKDTTPKDKPPPPKPEETKSQKFKRQIKKFTPLSFLDKLSNSKLARINNALQRQNYINSLDLTNKEDKEEYDRIMNQLGGLGMDIIARPGDLKDTRLTVPPSMLATDPMTQFKTVDGVSALGNPGVDDVLGTGYDEYLNRFNVEDTGGRDDTLMDPCKGPNPPAYCFIGDKADETQEAAVTRNLSGLTPRIGGSIFNFDNMADGGIAGMDREAFLLGGIAKGLKKAVRGVKKLVKSPVGKMALGAAIFSGGFGLGGLQRGLFGITAKGQALRGFPELAAKKGLLAELGLTGGYGSFMPTIKGGILGASLLSGLTAKEDKGDEELAKYLASQKLDPSQSIRGMGSEFDFYGGEKMRVADGGIIRAGYQEGGDVEPVAKKTMPLLDMDGKEKDYRETGGFVDMGRMERADDVPARLSKNEFVFTADAVRNAGEGDIDKGAEVMYNMMKNLESGGEVSEESQGLEGARKMFQTSQRLGEVI